MFYVSSHGFGHMTRNLAVMEEILEHTDNYIYLASGKLQNRFEKNYLNKYKHRLIFKDICTDIGLVNQQNTLMVNSKELEETLYDFIDTWEYIVVEEYHYLKNFDIRYVITDISPIGSLVGKQLKVKTIGISNFTWVEQYEFLGISDSIIKKFKDAYANLDTFIAYPLALPMNDLKVSKSEIGFITRRIDLKRVNEIKEKYGKSLFITCGKSANLKSISIQNYDGTIFTTSGITITGNSKVVKLPINTLDTQNYIAASDIVISKAGWSTISEAVMAKQNLVLIEREDVLEDSHNIKQLKKQHLAISIKEDELRTIDIESIKMQCEKNIIFIQNDISLEENKSILDKIGIEVKTSAIV